MVTRRFAIAALSILTASPSYAGAWGPGSFENDGALDWIIDFARAPSVEFVRSSLERALADGVIDSLHGQAALAAAEVVASGVTSSTQLLPAEIQQPAAAIAANVKQLAPLATKAVRSVASQDSELRHLWGERQESNARWHAQVEDLLRRLSSHAAQPLIAPGGSVSR
ncbi:DUF4259 domain-containing protein [Pelomonas cellulosilytica]|uniref:DUF4259 domain-containing protein n=1 Tax=Pelomonas cellulosilytica TaxID=2906762 RepID=UPI003B026344